MKSSREAFEATTDLDQINITGASNASSNSASSSSTNTDSSIGGHSTNAILFSNNSKNQLRKAQLIKNPFLIFSRRYRSSSAIDKMGNILNRKDKIAANKGEIRLSEEELNLLLKNTNMSRDQIIEFHQKFLQDCPTGILTKKEFVKMFQQLHPNEEKRKKVEKFCEYVFKSFFLRIFILILVEITCFFSYRAIDKDSNDKIEFTDFVVVFSITSFGDLKEKISLAFKIYDLGNFSEL